MYAKIMQGTAALNFQFTPANYVIIMISMRYGISKKNAFTLIEIVIVIILLGILAAMFLPYFRSPADDTTIASTKTDLQTVRFLLQLYRVQHSAVYPESMDLMTTTTSGDGKKGTGPDYPYGPYIPTVPVNSYLNKNTVLTVPSMTDNNPKDGSTGWYYNPTTGTFRANVNVVVNNIAIGDL